MCTATGPAAPASTGQALAMVRAGLEYLADCDAGSLATTAQAEALIGLEHAEAQHTAARAKILSVFTAQQGYEADGYHGAASWLRAITKVTKGAAAGATGWARRLDGHPVIAAALADGRIPVSLARLICDSTDKLPEDLRDDADGILLAAVLGGADQHDLARLAREMLERAQTSPDRDNDGFEERALWLETTFGGAGRLQGDLTPACSAALTVVLEALGQKAGPEDTRTLAQRRHDAVEEACRRLIGGRMIPGRDGQPPHLNLHIDLNELRGGSALERSWTPAKAAAGPGSAYLTGPAAEAAACDAVLTTIVTGQIDWQVLDQLTTLWLTPTATPTPRRRPRDGRHATATSRPPATATPVTATGHSDGQAPGDSQTPGDGQAPTDRDSQAPGAGHHDGPAPGTGPCPAPARAPAPATPRAPAARTATTAGSPAAWRPPGNACRPRSCAGASTFCPGPAGSPPTCAAPCSAPRSTPPASPWTSAAPPAPSPRTCAPPSSSATSTAVPRLHPATVRLRGAPPDPLGQGGPTSLGNLRLLCRFHHLIVIHQWGWTITCHPDGTRTATAPDGRTLHSHGPPQQAA